MCKLLIFFNSVQSPIEILDEKSVLIVIFQSLVDAKATNKTCFVLNAPSGLPMMIDPIAICHMAILN